LSELYRPYAFKIFLGRSLIPLKSTGRGVEIYWLSWVIEKIKVEGLKKSQTMVGVKIKKSCEVRKKNLLPPYLE